MTIITSGHDVWAAAVVNAGNLRLPMQGDVPDQPDAELPAELAGKVDTVLGFGLALVIAACVGGVLICAGFMALAYRRGELGEAGGRLGGVAAACVLAGSASAVVSFLYA